MQKATFWGFILVFLLTNFHNLQASKTDSLTRILSETTDKETQVRTLFKLYRHWEFTNPIESEYYLNELKLRKESPIARIYIHLVTSQYFRNAGETDSAIFHINQWLDLAQKHDITDLMLSAYGDLGFNEMQRNNYFEAIEYLEEGKRLALQYEEPYYYSVCHSLLARVYHNFGNYNEAIAIIKETIANYSNSDRKSLGNLSGYYNNLGIIYKDADDIDSSILYHNKSLAISEQLGDTISIAKSYNNLGLMYMKSSNFEMALSAFDSSMFFHQKAGRFRPEIALQVAKCLMLTAQDCVRAKTIALANRDAILLSGNLESMRTLYETLTGIYSCLNNSDSALLYLKDLRIVENNLQKEEYPEILRKLEARTELKHKDREIDLLKEKAFILRRERTIIIAVGIAILLLIAIIVFLFYKQFQTRTEVNKLHLEQQLLRSQMNPHFIFNALSIVQSFIIHNEPKTAGKYLSKFAKLMRLILENSREQSILLSSELESIELYLNLQRVRLNNRFSYSIVVDENLDESSIYIPPMYYQPFIENALEHGIQHLNGEGIIEISISGTKEYIVFELIDNGIGRSKSRQLNASENTEHNSLSTTITKERLAGLKNKALVRFEIEDYAHPTTGSGTRVLLQIPL